MVVVIAGQQIAGWKNCKMGLGIMRRTASPPNMRVDNVSPMMSIRHGLLSILLSHINLYLIVTLEQILLLLYSTFFIAKVEQGRESR